MRRRALSLLPITVAAVLLVGAAVWLVVISRENGTRAFYAAQGVLVLALLLLWLFYSRMVKPIGTIANGINLLREQDFSTRLAPVGQPDADRIVGMFNEMMGRLKTERLRIREQNHFLDLLINESPMGVIVLDRHDRIGMLNKAAAEMLGTERDAATGRCVGEMEGQLAQALGALRTNETRTLRLNNAMVYRCARLSYMDQGFSHPFMLVERLTDEVMRAERTAYEKVIRMMAHEVNNSMAGVNSILDTAAGCIGDPDIAEALDACRHRCMMMSEFITSFASVVKIPEAKLQRTELNTFLADTRRVLESMCAGRGIALHVEPQAVEATVMADTVLMEQVLINLVKNAVESIGERGGEISVRGMVSPAGFVVEDNGPGIDAGMQEKIFTPFFSSKASGRGLGLLFVSDILNKHHCGYSLRTDADGRTRFTVVFPR